jgi:hypothetical protein
MQLKKIIVLLVAAILMATPAIAGNVPEFDAVACDASNYFAVRNNAQHVPVIFGNSGPFGPINFASAFRGEFFSNTAGQLFPDPCFEDYPSALTDAWNQGTYTWQIVLQMKPESDINLNIYDCVLKHNGWNIFFDAEQTGRYRADWGQLFFVPTANPSVTARVFPGEFATPGFPEEGFILDSRTLPGLNIVALDNVLYTSKAHWEEGLVLVLPETGTTNASGQSVYNLKQGDYIRVDVTIPFNNSVDLRYGADSVILKYIGIVGTWYYGNFCSEG